MYTSLPSHPDYPALPAQAVDITPDGGCANCSLAQTAGHKSCATFRMRNAPVVPDSSRISLRALREMKGQLHRRAFDADGIIGSLGDFWYYNNASRAVNFCFFSSWVVTSVSGDLVTLQVTGEDDARSVLFASWSETETVIGYYRINGFYSVTATQPLDMLEFEWPSKGHYLKSKILQVTAGSATSLTVRIDKDLGEVWDSFFQVSDGEGGYEDDPETVTAKVYHYGREQEQGTYVVEPNYFYGRHTEKEVLTSALPTDKIWELETTVICPPESFDPLNSPNWVLEGYADGVWTQIDEDTRLHINHTGARVALGTTLPTGSVREIPTTDLTETYTKFRAVYYVQTTPEDDACSIRGYDRCYYSRIDPSNSAGNFGTTKGAGVTADGKHVYCAKRVYEEYEYVDDFSRITNSPGSDGIPDRAEVTLHHPTGLEDFPSDTGQCVQYGYCNKHENTLNHTGDAEAPFCIDDSMKLLTEIWFSCDKRRVQRHVLAQGPRGYVVERIASPGILWLNGYYGGLVTPGGWHPTAEMRGDGTWFTKKPRTVVDQDGNESLVAPGGLEEGLLMEYDEATESMVVVDDVVGSIPDAVEGFKVRRDPFTPGATVESNLLEYIGATVTRDTGQISGSRGLSGISVALPAETIVAPGFDLSVAGVQTSYRASFEWSGDAEDDGVLTIMPYAQEGKETSLGSRTIHSIESLGDHRYRIIFENETKTFSRFNLGDLGTIGDSYDKIDTVMAGGGPCILPCEHQGLFSWDGDKDTGSRHAGVSPLDCLEVDGHRFVVEEAIPHYTGSVAPTWGSRILTNKGGIGGYYELPVNNHPTTGEPLLPITLTSVRRTSDDTFLNVIQWHEPVHVSAGQCRYDEDRKIYFSAGDAWQYVEVKYKDALTPTPTDYTQGFTVVPYFTVNLDTPYSEWTGAATKTIYIGTTAATVVEGGYDDPPQGTVRVNETWDNKVQLTFSIDDAGSDWRMVLTFATDAPAPQDDWAVGGKYTEFGRNRDAVIVRADAYATGDYFTETSVVGETAEFFRSATVFLPKSDLVLNTTVKTTDAWTAVPTDKRWPNAASGRIRIDGGYLATLSGEVCWQLEVRMVDSRGFVPASLLNKTQAVLDATQWCLTTMGGALGANIARYESAYFDYSLDSRNPDALPWDNCVLSSYTVGEMEVYKEDSSTGNYVYVELGNKPGPGGYVRLNQASLSYSLLNSFGAPPVINNLPDGCEILEAVMELYTTGLTRSYQYSMYEVLDCEGNVVQAPVLNENSNLENISYSLIGLTSDKSYEVIGTIPGANNGRKVMDCTAIMQTMYANRKNGNYPNGYGVIFVPPEAEGGIEALVPTGIPNIVTLSGDCMPCGENSMFNENEWTYITWGGVSIGRIALRIKYNGTDKLNLGQPRFPSFADVT